MIDSATLLGGLIEQAREQAAVPTGFFAAITRGQDGRELVDMAELAGRGGGPPPRRATCGAWGRPSFCCAPDPSTITGLKLTLHEEEITLAPRAARMHEGAALASSGWAATRRWPRA